MKSQIYHKTVPLKTVPLKTVPLKTVPLKTVPLKKETRKVLKTKAKFKFK